jgi:hypothetical protein
MLPRSLNPPDIRTAEIRAFVAPVGSTQVMVLDFIPTTTPGTVEQCYCWTAASDVGTPADVSSTIQESLFRVSAVGALTPVTANRLDKQTAGGAGSFAQDVDFAVVPALPVGTLALFAANGGAAARTGNIVVWYWINRGAWR